MIISKLVDISLKLHYELKHGINWNLEDNALFATKIIKNIQKGTQPDILVFEVILQLPQKYIFAPQNKFWKYTKNTILGLN